MLPCICLRFDRQRLHEFSLPPGRSNNADSRKFVVRNKLGLRRNVAKGELSVYYFGSNQHGHPCCPRRKLLKIIHNIFLEISNSKLLSWCTSLGSVSRSTFEVTIHSFRLSVRSYVAPTLTISQLFAVSLSSFRCSIYSSIGAVHNCSRVATKSQIWTVRVQVTSAYF